MAHPELEVVVAPEDSLAQPFQRLGVGLVQAGQLAGDAVVVIIVEGFAQAVEGPGDAPFGRCLGEVEPDRTVLDGDRIAPELIAADQGFAARQVEFPVVPVAGQDAAVAQGSHLQQVALVGTAVVAGVDALLGLEYDDLLAAVLEDQGALGDPQIFQAAGLHQAVGVVRLACRHPHHPFV